MSLHDWLADQRQARAEAGLTRSLTTRPAESNDIDLAGNDYLGLRTDPRVVAAAARGAIEWGAGAGASRLVTGTLGVHVDLEHALADFTGAPAALVFSTGYHANISAIAGLCDPDTLIVSDAHVHASLIDGCRLARHGGLAVVPHNDVDAVVAALDGRTQRRALVLAESVYSVLGDAAPIDRLAAVASEHDATLLVDEAHALGVSGTGGRGLVAEHELTGAPHVVVTATLSKALASQGGVVMGSPDVVEHLVNTARPFIYDTGLAPAAAAAALESLRIVRDDPALPGRTVEIAGRIATALRLPAPAGAVLSLAMGGPDDALRAQADLAADGFLVGCFRPPSTPDGVSRVRLSARATLTDEQVDRVVDRLARTVAAR
jgi:8-amino-7-oxononanoate synthase